MITHSSKKIFSPDIFVLDSTNTFNFKENITAEQYISKMLCEINLCLKTVYSFIGELWAIISKSVHELL